MRRAVRSELMHAIPPELALSRWGTSFAAEATERAYRAWNYERNRTTNARVSAVALLLWVLLCALFIGLQPERITPFLPLLGATLLSLGAMLAIARSPRLPVRAMGLTNLVHSALAGWTVVLIGNLVLRAPTATFGGLFMLSLVQFQFTTNFTPLRLIPLPVVSYFGGEAWYLLDTAAARQLSTSTALGECLGLVMCFGFGLLTALVGDATARRWFAQDRIIEAQQRTIETERARIEQLLHDEVRYQVAARSREIGTALAKADAREARLPFLGATVLGRYRIDATLGSGAMGAVYEVERLSDGQRFALKVAKGTVSGAALARFAREAEIGARLRHRRLVSIVDIGVSEGTPFLVMELVRGESLETQRARFGDRPWALTTLRQLAEGLAALHAAGVVHRDLKPANVLLARSEGAPDARISDFGISRFEVTSDEGAALAKTLAPDTPPELGLTRTGALMGTPLYMAPEAASGAQHVGPPADLFALGLIAHELLKGSPAFSTPAVLRAMANQPPEPAPLLELGSGALALLLQRCLSETPAQRPLAAELVTVLTA